MSRRYGFLPGAQAELRRAVRFYETERPGLGAEFAAEVRGGIESLLDNPLTGSPAEAGTRRKPLARFPYSIIYLAEPDGITLVAVMHHRRRPGYWLKRLS